MIHDNGEDAAAMAAAADLIDLPADRLPCCVCGASCPEGGESADRLIFRTTPAGGPLPDVRVPLTRCDDCAERRALALALVESHHAMAAKLGPDHAQDVAEGAVIALALLAQPMPSPDISGADLGALVRNLARPGLSAAWRVIATPGQCCPHPFAHVSAEAMAGLRRAYASALAERIARSSPPVRLAPPDGPPGCLLCGVGSVVMEAARVVRLGGRGAATREAWTPLGTTPGALGAPGAEPVKGHLCPGCSAAVLSCGAVGPSAAERSLLLHLCPEFKDHLPYELPEMEGLAAWGALVVAAQRRGAPPPEPGRTRWAHVPRPERLAGRLRALLGAD